MANCLFCADSCANYADGDPLEFRSDGDDSAVHKHLKSFFVLKTILKIPDNVLIQLLGLWDGESHPEKWFKLCLSCWELVINYQNDKKLIFSLEGGLVKTENELREKIANSWDGGWGGDSVRERIRDEVMKVFPPDFAGGEESREASDPLNQPFDEESHEVNSCPIPELPVDSPECIDLVDEEENGSPSQLSAVDDSEFIQKVENEEDEGGLVENGDSEEDNGELIENVDNEANEGDLLNDRDIEVDEDDLFENGDIGAGENELLDNISNEPNQNQPFENSDNEEYENDDDLGNHDQGVSKAIVESRRIPGEAFAANIHITADGKKGKAADPAVTMEEVWASYDDLSDDEDDALVDLQEQHTGAANASLNIAGLPMPVSTVGVSSSSSNNASVETDGANLDETPSHPPPEKLVEEQQREESSSSSSVEKRNEEESVEDNLKSDDDDDDTKPSIENNQQGPPTVVDLFSEDEDEDDDAVDDGIRFQPQQPVSNTPTPNEENVPNASTTMTSDPLPIIDEVEVIPTPTAPPVEKSTIDSSDFPLDPPCPPQPTAATGINENDISSKCSEDDNDVEFKLEDEDTQKGKTNKIVEKSTRVAEKQSSSSNTPTTSSSSSQNETQSKPPVCIDLIDSDLHDDIEDAQTSAKKPELSATITQIDEEPNGEETKALEVNNSTPPPPADVVEPKSNQEVTTLGSYNQTLSSIASCRAPDQDQETAPEPVPFTNLTEKEVEETSAPEIAAAEGAPPPEKPTDCVPEINVGGSHQSSSEIQTSEVLPDNENNETEMPIPSSSSTSQEYFVLQDNECVQSLLLESEDGTIVIIGQIVDEVEEESPILRSLCLPPPDNSEITEPLPPPPPTDLSAFTSESDLQSIFQIGSTPPVASSSSSNTQEEVAAVTHIEFVPSSQEMIEGIPLELLVNGQIFSQDELLDSDVQFQSSPPPTPTPLTAENFTLSQPSSDDVLVDQQEQQQQQTSSVVIVPPPTESSLALVTADPPATITEIINQPSSSTSTAQAVAPLRSSSPPKNTAPQPPPEPLDIHPIPAIPNGVDNTEIISVETRRVPNETDIVIHNLTSTSGEIRRPLILGPPKPPPSASAGPSHAVSAQAASVLPIIKIPKLNSNLNWREGARQFSCVHCSFKTKSHDLMENHSETHTPDRVSYAYSASCNGTLSNFMTHIRTAHGGGKPGRNMTMRNSPITATSTSSSSSESDNQQEQEAREQIPRLEMKTQRPCKMPRLELKTQPVCEIPRLEMEPERNPTPSPPIASTSKRNPTPDSRFATVMVGDKFFYQCKKCPIKRMHMEEIQAHVILHEPKAKPTPCGLCGFPVDPRQMEHHWITSHPNENKDFFVTKLFDTSIGRNKLTYHCRHCPAKYINIIKSIRSHLRLHMPNSKGVTCLEDGCGWLLFLDKITNHLNRYHPDSREKCSKCNLEFMGKNFLEIHKKLHERECVCDTCGIIVKNLERHEIHCHYNLKKKAVEKRQKEEMDKKQLVQQWVTETSKFNLPSSSNQSIELPVVAVAVAAPPGNVDEMNQERERVECDVCGWMTKTLDKHKRKYHKKVVALGSPRKNGMKNNQEKKKATTASTPKKGERKLDSSNSFYTTLTVNGQKYFKCRLCGTKLKSKALFSSHLKTHKEAVFQTPTKLSKRKYKKREAPPPKFAKRNGKRS